MRKTTFLTRVLALVLSVMLVLTGMPMAVFAEEEQSSETQETLDASEITESSTDEAATGTGEDTVEDQPVTEETEDAAELEPDDVLSEVTPDDAETDLSVEDGNPDETVTDAEIVLDEEELPVIDEAEDEIVWEDEEQDDYMIVKRPMLRSAINPSRFTGAEEVRLGKEGNNIYGIIVQKDGSSSTSITRHWVTVDGVKYTAFCIESSDASTSGRDGGLEPGMDAGLLWILCNVPDTSDEDYARITSGNARINCYAFIRCILMKTCRQNSRDHFKLIPADSLIPLTNFCFALVIRHGRSLVLVHAMYLLHPITPALYREKKRAYTNNEHQFSKILMLAVCVL